MKIYKCDGIRYEDNSTCQSESTHDLPERWLTIEGEIKNGLHDARIIEANSVFHFCTRTCFEFFFFKGGPLAITTNPPSNISKLD